MEQVYEIVSIRRAGPPPGAIGANWHSYVISFGGTKTVYGCRKGSRETVTKEVEEIVAQLNERQRTKRGRVNLIPTPR